MSKRIFIAILLMSGIVSTAVESKYALLDRNLDFRIKGSNDNARLEFTLKDNKGGVLLPVPAITDSREKLQISYVTDFLIWDTAVTSVGEMFSAESELTNKGKTELWLEPGLAFQFDRNFPVFWDGYGKTNEVKEKALSRIGLKGAVMKHVAASTFPFPANAVIDKDKAFYLGTVPYDPVSYTAASYSPSAKRLESSQRIVISPGQTVKIRQTIGYVFTPYGLPEGIVQAYYDSFPEAYAISGGQDNKYVWGTHGHYLNWWEKPDRELSRRFHITIEWTYCPYRRSGDMLCRPEFYDYKPRNHWRVQNGLGGIKMSHAKLSRAELLNMIKDNYLKYGRTYGWMYYNTVSGTWCEEQLAKECYPDSINSDTDGGVPACYHSTWSTHHDSELRVFPYYTSFAEDFEKSMVKLVKELNLPGFSLDCAYGGAYYRGPAVNKPIPGRTWDDKGKFIDQGVAVNHEVDFIRNINCTPGRELTVFFNGNCKGDYVMTEASFVDAGQYKSWFPLLRWVIGPRPGTTHKHGFCIKQVKPDWKTLSKEEFTDLITRLSDYMILNQFQHGLANDQLSMFGNPQMIYIQPESFELMRALWQVEIPLKTQFSGRVRYISRYGKGTNTYFFFGNSSSHDVTGRISADNSRLTHEGDTILFVRKMRDQASTVNLCDGKFTTWETVVPSRVPMIFESVAALKAPAGKILVVSKKSLDKVVFTLRSEMSFRSKVEFRPIRNFTLSKVTLDGKAIAFDKLATRDTVNFSKGSVLKAEYRSDIFHLTRGQLDSFAFSNAQKVVNFKIQATPKAKAAAERFNEFFRFCASAPAPKSVSMKGDIPLTLTASPKADKDTVAVILGSNYGIRMNAYGGLIVEAPDTEKLDGLMTELFYVLDQRYPAKIGFRARMGITQEMINFFKLQNTALPLRKYFEGGR